MSRDFGYNERLVQSQVTRRLSNLGLFYVPIIDFQYELSLPFFLLTAWLLLPLLDYELLSPIPSFEIEKKIKILQQCLIWRAQFNNPKMATHKNVTLLYWCFFSGHLIPQTLILVHRWNIYSLKGEWQWEVFVSSFKAVRNGGPYLPHLSIWVTWGRWGDKP